MGSNTRCIVIELAVNLERSISVFLAYMLDITLENSKTLGNKSTALSFKTKVDLLTDMSIIDKEYATKLEHFAMIRNQFAHNADATDFTKYFSYIDGLDNKMKKWYGREAQNSDEAVRYSWFLSLYGDFKILAEKCLSAAAKKAYLQGKAQGHEDILKELDKISLNDPELASRMQQAREAISLERKEEIK